MVNYFQLCSYAFDYGLSAYKQLSFMRGYLKPMVDKHCTALNYPLSEKEKKKVGFYYPLFNHIVNCENYLCIKGRRLTIDETKRMAIISAMATLHDDLIDEENWDKETYSKVLDRTLPSNLQTPKVKLIFALEDELHKIWQPTNAYINALKIATDWQIISSKQLDKNISLQETLYISENKCGNSSLLWASVMSEDWLQEDDAFIFQSGFVGQIVNDLFDAFKDREDGVYTIVRKAASIAQAKEIFLRECTKLHQLILQCNVPHIRKVRTIRRMACVHAFALVALEHLQNTENKYGKPMQWEKPLRKELVTDLAFWSNKFKLLQYACSLAELR
ncbi:MAG: class 1 isoprenoid biosynthesis enzyme [Chitinophagaceae bacterium]|nr:class 1 isoprenoid biosynthesis enzyme [Chitinophagaceae bacterium]MCW5906213.1 class 1 isoprenoid biosynthesis enzyme [Chitinophagaceae bacterium]